MNVGDRVRLLRGNEEGTITKISSGGRIEIEIEDGFRIPALSSEVVVVSEAERQYFGDGKISTPKEAVVVKKGTGGSSGLFLGYIPLNDKDHSIYLINNTGRDYVYSVSEGYGENSHTLSAGLCNAGSHHKLDEKSIIKFEESAYVVSAEIL